MINPIQAAAMMFYAIPLIAVFDWLIFHSYGACDKCGNLPHKNTWIVACVMESLFFIAGIVLGVGLK
jgi:hypothetical protein